MLINYTSLPGLNSIGQTHGAFGDLSKLLASPQLPMPGMNKFNAEFQGFGQAQATQPSVGDDFSNVLKNAIDQVDEQDQKARTSALDMALGQNIDPHTVMIEYAKDSTMIHLASGITTRMAQDFTTLMNMQV